MGFILREAQIVYQRGSRIDVPRKIQSSRDVNAIMHAGPMEGIGAVPLRATEAMVALALDAKTRVIGWTQIGAGDTASTPASAANVWRFALMSSARSIVLVHNHPSGEATPSAEDIALTERIVAGGRLLEVEILDHVIVTSDPGVYFSFLDSGLLGR